MGVELSTDKLDSGWSDLLGEEFKEEREGPAGKEEVPAELPTEPPVMEAEHPPAEAEPIAILPAEIPARIRLKVAIDGGPDIGILHTDSEHDVTEIDSDGDLWIAVNDDANDGLCVPADAYEVVAWKPAMVAGEAVEAGEVATVDEPAATVEELLPAEEEAIVDGLNDLADKLEADGSDAVISTTTCPCSPSDVQAAFATAAGTLAAEDEYAVKIKNATEWAVECGLACRRAEIALEEAKAELKEAKKEQEAALERLENLRIQGPAVRELFDKGAKPAEEVVITATATTTTLPDPPPDQWEVPPEPGEKIEQSPAAIPNPPSPAPITVPHEEAWRHVALSDLEKLTGTGIPAGILKALDENPELSIRTVGDLQEWTERCADYDSPLTIIPKVGKGKAEKIENAMEAFWGYLSKQNRSVSAKMADNQEAEAAGE